MMWAIALIKLPSQGTHLEQMEGIRYCSQDHCHCATELTGTEGARLMGVLKFCVVFCIDFVQVQQSWWKQGAHLMGGYVEALCYALHRFYATELMGIEDARLMGMLKLCFMICVVLVQQSWWGQGVLVLWVCWSFLCYVLHRFCAIETELMGTGGDCLMGLLKLFVLCIA